MQYLAKGCCYYVQDFRMKTGSPVFNMFVTLSNEQYKQFMQACQPSITLEDQQDISGTRAKSREYSLDLEN